MAQDSEVKTNHTVAPLAGAWIEIDDFVSRKYQTAVAPLAGAWIEIMRGYARYLCHLGRSPRGSVD